MLLSDLRYAELILRLPKNHPISENSQLRNPVTPKLCYVRNVDLGRSAIVTRLVVPEEGARLGIMAAAARGIGFSILRLGRVISGSLSSSNCVGLNSVSSISDGSGSGGSEEFSVSCVLAGVVG